MKARIVRCNNPAMIAELDRLIFPEDYAVKYAGSVWWVATVEGSAVAFAGVKLIDGYAFHTRAGILPDYRGHGLQKKLIAKREAYAFERGAKAVCTYTLVDNCASSNSLIGAGYHLFEPEWKWAGKECLYWRKKA